MARKAVPMVMVCHSHCIVVANSTTALDLYGSWLIRTLAVTRQSRQALGFVVGGGRIIGGGRRQIKAMSSAAGVRTYTCIPRRGA